MTREEAIAACARESGWGLGACVESVDAQMVGGVYCDGTIVIDESGRRCVPRAVVDRVRQARNAAPLVDQEPEAGAGLVVVGLVVLGLVAGAWLLAREA